MTIIESGIDNSDHDIAAIETVGIAGSDCLPAVGDAGFLSGVVKHTLHTGGGLYVCHAREIGNFPKHMAVHARRCHASVAQTDDDA